MPKKLLIVSYTFPPTPGIGGRRWAKFAKYLVKMGYDVTVICSENIVNQRSVWLKDVEGIETVILPYNFPREVSFPKPGLFNKVLYFFSVKVLQLADNGNYFDRTVFWERQVQNKAAQIIKEKNINCVIVTSGPFRLSHYVAKLSALFPEVKFIVDFRDLWTEDAEITSFSALSPKRKAVEKRFEKETVYLADKVISVAEELNSYFSSLTIQNKFAVISNGYDPDDFKELQPTGARPGTKIKFVFTGTLYINLDYILQPFFEALGQLRTHNLELFEKLEFEFVGRFPEGYKKYLSEYGIGSAFKFTKGLSLTEVYGKIINADYGLLFLNNVYNFALSTKFCEYISQRKKIIIVSNKGPASEFITENKIGYWIDPANALKDFTTVVLNTLNHNAQAWDSEFDPEVFSIPNITRKLAGIIEEPFVAQHSVNDRHLLLTFDYELFLGKKSGSVANCILKPTELILDLFKRQQFSKAIFFIDTIYMKRMQESVEENCKADLARIKQQLIAILKGGNYIFPHLHPHWLDAVYDKESNQWKLESTDNYMMKAIPENKRDELFSFSIAFIRQMQLEAGVNYEIDSFRAGGWCIQPFEIFKPYFEKYGLKNDFSALRGFKMPGKNINYDFTAMPPKNIYNFNNHMEREENNGKFRELVITRLNIKSYNRFLNKFLSKFLWYTKQTGFGDGFSAVDGEASVILSIQNMKKITSYNGEMASCELLTAFTYGAYKKYIEENDFMQFISHPKMISRHNLAMLENFLKFAKNKFNVITDYKTMIN